MKHATFFCTLTLFVFTSFHCSADITENMSSDAHDPVMQESEHDEKIPTVTIDKLDLFEQETPIEEYARQLINLILDVLTEPSQEHKEALNAYVAHHLTRLTTVYDVSLNLTVTPRATFPTHRFDSSSSHRITRSKHKELMHDTEKITKQETKPEAQRNDGKITPDGQITPAENMISKERQQVAENLLDVARSLGEIIKQPDRTPQQLAGNLVDVFLNLFRMGATIVLADS